MEIKKIKIHRIRNKIAFSKKCSQSCCLRKKLNFALKRRRSYFTANSYQIVIKLNETECPSLPFTIHFSI